MNSVKTSTFVWGCVLCATAVFGCALRTPRADYSQSDLYYGFTLIDPASKSIRNDAYLVITDGRFSEVGSGKPPQKNFRTRRALPGRFGLPGFVDAHAHITAGPHKVAIVNGAPAVTIESIDDVTQFNARMALAFGVTTVRNPAGDPLANAQVQSECPVWCLDWSRCSACRSCRSASTFRRERLRLPTNRCRVECGSQTASWLGHEVLQAICLPH